jgi:hypothetical protein
VYVSFVLLSIVACNNQPSATEQIKDTQTIKQVEAASPADIAVAREVGIKQLDALEKLFDNQNYLSVEGKDSNYIYFSRLGKNNFYTHSFKMVKGDSANVVIDTLQVNAANKVQWQWQKQPLVLLSTTDFSSAWLANNKDTILFQKIDGNTLQVVSNGKKNSLHKTPTLSLFLVRSYYDYTHGTHLAFDNTNFTKKH